jgi:hypothetical protein
MIDLVSTSQGSTIEIARRYLSSERELTWSDSVTLAAAGGVNAPSLHSPLQPLEDLRDSRHD